MMALDGERLRPLAQDLDDARIARLDPERRALGARVAQQRPEHELGLCTQRLQAHDSPALEVVNECRLLLSLCDRAVHLEHLGVLAVHVDPVRAGEAPDVLGVGVAAVLLRGVAVERGDLEVDVAPLERDVGLVGEVEVVPGDLVAEDRRPLERAQALGGDRLVVLVDVVQRGLEDDVGLPVVPELDQELEDLLAVVGEGADVEVVDGQVLAGDPELGRRRGDLVAERVGRRSPPAASAWRSRRRRNGPRRPPRRAAPSCRRSRTRRRRCAARERARASSRRSSALGLRLAQRDGGQGDQAPEQRVLDQGVVEAAVHDDRDQG